jgi:hypothetical protein
LLGLTLFASLDKKSAIVYYGKNISYSMVGIHDYIIVKPENINSYRHGFKIYNEKIYAAVDLEQDLDALYKNLADIHSRGFENFYLTFYKNRKKSIPTSQILTYISSKYPNAKIALNAKLKIKTDLYETLQAVVVPSGTTLSKKMKKLLNRGRIAIIKLVVKSPSDVEDSQSTVKEIEKEGMIPYISDVFYDIYGLSSKVAVKREVFTLVDESKYDRTLLAAHQIGALPLEYLGYVQKLYDVNKGLPDVSKMHHYAGVIIWLSGDYEDPAALIEWVLELNKAGIKVAFVNNFGFSSGVMLLKPLDIDVYDGDESPSNKKRIFYQDKMIGFEVNPSLGESSIYMKPENAKPLLVYEDLNGLQSTPAAITAWGGYAVGDAFTVELGDENVWVINPFSFFAEALRLKPLLIPDPTTHNGKRTFFTHVDGDGMVNVVEFDPELYSGEIILKEILKKYDIPHSVSIIGAEVEKNGLFPKLSKRLLNIAREMYALPNVEAATHTFTHPFFWGKIKDGNLDAKYRLKPKHYHFSLENELSNTLKFINTELLTKSHKKRAQTVFWSGDCAPRVNALEYVYKHNILNINGGDTTISNVNPWLTLVAPLGLERGGFYQIYTGAQNENVFTNDWLGPFWGFKRVVQTFKLTGYPRRLKPIDVYYHIYTGSKKASVNALKFVLDWCLKQDIFPMFTSEYIPKAMDYFSASIANEGDYWLVDGMKDLKTVRLNSENERVDYKKSSSVYGEREVNGVTYISLGDSQRHLIKLREGKKESDTLHIHSTNATITEFIKGVKNSRYTLNSYVDVKFSFHLPHGCTYKTKPKAEVILQNKQNITLFFKNSKEGVVDVICR